MLYYHKAPWHVHISVKYEMGYGLPVPWQVQISANYKIGCDPHRCKASWQVQIPAKYRAWVGWGQVQISAN